MTFDRKKSVGAASIEILFLCRWFCPHQLITPYVKNVYNSVTVNSFITVFTKTVFKHASEGWSQREYNIIQPIRFTFIHITHIADRTTLSLPALIICVLRIFNAHYMLAVMRFCVVFIGIFVTPGRLYQCGTLSFWKSFTHIYR